MKEKTDERGAVRGRVECARAHPELLRKSKAGVLHV